jgi:predicted membrane-bound spermidine synthase
MLILLAVLFVLSGAAGLIYESIWGRYLGLFVGHSAYAQVLVLVIFLGGMSAGAWLVSRWSRRVARPLLAYALVEAVVGLIGLFFHEGYEVVTGWAYVTLFPALGEGASLQAAKWLIGALLILPQSLLLGATFPLMSAGVLRLSVPGRAGHQLAVLYAANSFGAAVGVLLAGFLFLPMAGLPGTVLVAAMLNLGCAAIVYLAVRYQETRGLADEAPPTAPPVPGSAVPAGIRRLLLATAFGTAVASFFYEIAWIRMLSLVLGSATHSFELMLSAFILGLAIGSWWIRSRIDRLADPMATLTRIQVVMAVLAALTVGLYLVTFPAMEWVLGAIARSESGYRVFTLVRYALCLALMLPATICAGMTLPLITRLLAGAGEDERAIGQVYAVNTIGSIIGAALASLVLLPVLGLRLLLLLGAAVDLGCGVLLARGAPAIEPSHRRRLMGGVLLATGLLVVLGVGIRFDTILLSSGVFRTGRINRNPDVRTVFYQDGRTATVSVLAVGEAPRGQRMVATNGKPDASLTLGWLDTTVQARGTDVLSGDEATQALLPLVTIAHRPAARRAAVIGQGSGMSSHFLLASPGLDSLYTIEIEPAMIAASRAFYPANRRVFDDPRSRFLIDDARSVFAGSRRTFDLILSEPSNPWVSGVSGLFTEEFYARVRKALAPGGVFGQWMHLYEMSDDLLLSVLRALHRQLPTFRIFLTNGNDLLIVAVAASTMPPLDWRIWEWPALRRDLARFAPVASAHVELAAVASSDVLAPLLAEETGYNSDFYPLLDLGAERTRFLGVRATAFSGQGLSSDRFDVLRALAGVPIAPVPATPSALIIPRVRRGILGARLRSGTIPPATERSLLAIETREALRKVRLFTRELEGGEEPTDWSGWLQQFAFVEELLHGGLAGVADTMLFTRAEAFARRHGAPVEVLSAVRLHRAAALWDWPSARTAGQQLAARRLAGDRLVADDFLRDVLAVALLKTGARDSAAVAFEQLAPFSTRAPSDLRSQLLSAYVRRRPDT